MSDTMSLYDWPVRRALAEMPPTTRAAWRASYLTQDGAELRAQALVERAETAMRDRGEATTIRDVWMLLAGRSGQEDNTDLQAAAALAGMAMGLRGR